MKRSRSWISLLTFCASASLAAALVLAAIFTVASVVVATAASAAAAAAEPNAAPQPLFSGLISDYQCGARHDKESGKSPAECTLACVRNGGKYSLVNGDKKYVLEGNAEELSHWAGQRVTVAGTRSGDTIKVVSVSTAH